MGEFSQMKEQQKLDHCWNARRKPTHDKQRMKRNSQLVIDSHNAFIRMSSITAAGRKKPDVGAEKSTEVTKSLNEH